MSKPKQKAVVAQIANLTPTQRKALVVAKNHNITPMQVKQLQTLKPSQAAIIPVVKKNDLSVVELKKIKDVKNMKGGNQAYIDAAVALAPEINKLIDRGLTFTNEILTNPTRVARVTAAQARRERQAAETDRRRQDAYNRKIRLRNELDERRRKR